MKVYLKGRMPRAFSYGAFVAVFFFATSLYWTHWTEHGVLRLAGWTAGAFVFGVVFGYHSPPWLIRTSDTGLQIGYTRLFWSAITELQVEGTRLTVTIMEAATAKEPARTSTHHVSTPEIESLLRDLAFRLPQVVPRT